jgi:transposase
VDKNGLEVRHQHSHQDIEYRRVELITGRQRRRDWTEDEKAEILAASAEPGSKVAQVARRYGVSRGSLFRHQPAQIRGRIMQIGYRNRSNHDTPIVKTDRDTKSQPTAPRESPYESKNSAVGISRPELDAQ